MNIKTVVSSCLAAALLGCANPNADKSSDQSIVLKRYVAALSEFKEGKYKEAAVDFGQFAIDYPNDQRTPDALYWMGSSYMFLGDCNKYIKSQTLLLDRWPNYSRADNIQKGMVLCEKVLAKSPPKPPEPDLPKKPPKPHSSDFVYIGKEEDKDSYLFYTKSSVKRSGDNVQVTAIWTSNKPLNDSKKSPQSVVTVLVYDCSSGKNVGIKSFESYTEGFGKGELVAKLPWPEDKSISLKDPTIKTLRAVVCGVSTE